MRLRTFQIQKFLSEKTTKKFGLFLFDVLNFFACPYINPREGKMFDEFLPERVARALELLNKKGLREIRIRVKMPILVDYGSLYYLGENGIIGEKEEALKCSFKEVQDIVFKACECSIYAHNEELKSGYISVQNGVRVGVCGQVVCEDGQVKTLKNFSSVAIRVPHQVPNCSLKALPYLFDENGIFNTLVIAPPGAGKTTFLRDLCYQFCSKNLVKNLLVIDERGEIASLKNGEPQLFVGNFCDVFAGASKSFGLENGIRTLAPQVVVMDEIAKPSDVEALDYAIGSGVKIVATAHSLDVDDFLTKPYFQELLKNKIFKRIVVLSCKNGVGTLEGVFNENQICLNFS